MLLELLDRGLAVADAHNPVAFALEIGSDGVTDCLLILDQQNLFASEAITRPLSQLAKNKPILTTRARRMPL